MNNIQRILLLTFKWILWYWKHLTYNGSLQKSGFLGGSKLCRWEYKTSKQKKHISLFAIIVLLGSLLLIMDPLHRTLVELFNFCFFVPQQLDDILFLRKVQRIKCKTSTVDTFKILNGFSDWKEDEQYANSEIARQFRYWQLSTSFTLDCVVDSSVEWCRRFTEFSFSCFITSLVFDLRFAILFAKRKLRYYLPHKLKWNWFSAMNAGYRIVKS